MLPRDVSELVLMNAMEDIEFDVKEAFACAQVNQRLMKHWAVSVYPWRVRYILPAFTLRIPETIDMAVWYGPRPTIVLNLDNVQLTNMFVNMIVKKPIDDILWEAIKPNADILAYIRGFDGKIDIEIRVRCDVDNESIREHMQSMSSYLPLTRLKKKISADVPRIRRTMFKVIGYAGKGGLGSDGIWCSENEAHAFNRDYYHNNDKHTVCLWEIGMTLEDALEATGYRMWLRHASD